MAKLKDNQSFVKNPDKDKCLRIVLMFYMTKFISSPPYLQTQNTTQISQNPNIINNNNNSNSTSVQNQNNINSIITTNSGVVDEPRRKRQDAARPNHILLFTIINPVYPINVVSFKSSFI